MAHNSAGEYVSFMHMREGTWAEVSHVPGKLLPLLKPTIMWWQFEESSYSQLVESGSFAVFLH